MPADALTLIVPARDAASRVGSLVRDWNEHFHKHQRPLNWIVVDDGSTDDTPGVLERLAAKYPNLRSLRFEKPQGFGACLREALSHTTDDWVGYLALDYPYKPADFDAMVKRFDQTIDVYGAQVAVAMVSGCRTGVPMPWFWKAVGRVYRFSTRIVMGARLEPLKGWLGFRNHWRSWWLWLTMGVPLVDVGSGLKVFRREWLDRFPLQSHGDFAHAEIVAKLTFLGAIIAEEPLSPRRDAIPQWSCDEFGTVLRNAEFHDRTQKPSGSEVPDTSLPDSHGS